MSPVEQGPTHDPEPLLYETASRGPRKRARQDSASAHHVSSGKHSVNRKHIRGRRGALKNLLEMPDDMMWEVFSRLEPYDLLRLARTTKALRTLLLNPSSAPVWRKCRDNVPGLPNCPKDLSEPKYAHLMFEQICHFCGTKNVLNVVIPARVRCCRKCGLERFQAIHQLDWQTDYHPDILKIAPQTLVHSNNAAWMEPSPKFYVSALRSLQTKYDTFDKADPLRAKWLKCRKKEHRLRMKDAEEIANFLAEDTERKREEKDRVRGERIEEILLRLRRKNELAMFDFNVLYDHPAVSQPKELTEQGWKKLEPILIKFMHEERKKQTSYNIVWSINE